MAFSELNGSFVGSQVRITVSDGAYDGILNSLDVNTPVKRLTLEKITSCKSGKKINGIQNFFSYEIKNVEIIQDNRKKVEKKREDVDGPFLVTRKQCNRHLMKIPQLDQNKILLKGQAAGEKTAPEQHTDTGSPIICIKNLKDALESRTEDQLSHQDWPSHYLVISKDDHIFSDAMIHIQKQTTIGLAVEGVKLGRHGTISFLQVGTRSYVFVFDVLALGKTLFEEGLKLILEHCNIQKVMHDCRWASDALFHQHGVKLINVFDTAVADMVVFKNRHNGDVPRYLQSIGTLLMAHLNFNSNDAHWYKTREHALQSDQKVWLTRPAPQRILTVAVRYVMYLVQLRVVMLDTMLEEFQDAVNAFLGFVRDAPEEKLESYDKNRHLLPTRLSRNYTSEAQHYQRIYKDRYQDKTFVENQRDSAGRRENCPGSLDTNIIFSHDSVWHQGDGKHMQGLSKTQALQECHRRGTFFQNSDTPMGMRYRASMAQKDQAMEEEADDDDDCLMALGEKQLNKVKKKRTKKQIVPAEEHITPVPYITSIPAGCAISSIDFPSCDIRIQRPKKPLVEGMADGSDDVIPCHSNLVKADPSKHKPVTTVGQKVAWGDVVRSSDTSDSDMQASSESQPANGPSRVADVSPLRDVNPRPTFWGRGVVALKSTLVANDVGVPASASDSSDSDSRRALGSMSETARRGFGRGVIKLLAEKPMSPTKQVPAAAAESEQFVNAD